jgi:hypothetical protein
MFKVGKIQSSSNSQFDAYTIGLNAIQFEMRLSIQPAYFIPFLLLFSLAACKDSNVQEQRIEKGVESIPAPLAANDPAQSTSIVQESESVDLHDSWIVPEGWVKDDSPRSMRLATYMIPTKLGNQEVAVSRFPGQVGGVLANINRWRGQMGLQPVTESQLAEHIERFTIESSNDTFDGYQTRIDSEQGVMIAIGLYQESINQTWFVRSTLPSVEIADQHQEEIIGFARSFAQ